MELGLKRVRLVAQRLGLLPVHVPVISVAGTNGKGSTAWLLDTVYRAAGYRTGLFTSPHMLRYNERVRIAGAEIGDQALCSAFAAIEAARGEVALTYFEFSTLAALWLFHTAKTDILLLEVGLGGRLDAVNIVDADVAIVTSIGLDHSEWLGDDKESIAREKAGIMRAGKRAVCAEETPQAALVTHAAEVGAPLWVAGRDFQMKSGAKYWDFRLPGGAYTRLPRPRAGARAWLNNAAAAVAAVHALQPALPVPKEALRTALAAPQLPGRFHIIPGAVETVYDIAHNAEAAAALAESLGQRPVQGRTLAVVGMLRDKPARAFGAALSHFVDAWFAGGLTGERGLAGAELAPELQGLGAPVQTCSSVPAAWHAAMAKASPGDRIVVCGSFHTVAAVMEVIGG
jgi:dihydrofolate synthase/folylpolyglutamate synthase